MKTPPMSFSAFLLGVGLMFTGVVFVDLWWRGLHRFPVEPQWQIEGADPRRGRDAVERFGCGACHVIPGIRHAQGRVGPQLDDFRNQIFVGGVLANTPENLVQWIRDPQHVNAETAMPTLNITDEEARDIASFLYTLGR